MFAIFNITRFYFCNLVNPPPQKKVYKIDRKIRRDEVLEYMVLFKRKVSETI